MEIMEAWKPMEGRNQTDKTVSDTFRGPNGRFLPGNPGGGRPPGSPHALAEFIKRDVLDAWNEVLPDGQRRGPKALRELSPKEFIEAASRICPKELFMAVQTEERSPFADLSPEKKREIAMKLYEQIETEAKIVNVGANVGTDEAESKS